MVRSEHRAAQRNGFAGRVRHKKGGEKGSEEGRVMQQQRQRRGRPLEKPEKGSREDGLGFFALSPKDW